MEGRYDATATNFSKTKKTTWLADVVSESISELRSLCDIYACFPHSLDLDHGLIYWMVNKLGLIF